MPRPERMSPQVLRRAAAAAAWARDDFLSSLPPGVSVLAAGKGLITAQVGEVTASRWWFALLTGEDPCGLITVRTLHYHPEHGLWHTDQSEHDGLRYYDVPKNVWDAVPVHRPTEESLSWSSEVRRRRPGLPERGWRR